jgi:hypothetical protein
MKLDITNYTIEELVELKNDIVNRIENYSDGYVYLCNVRSYGRIWKEHVYNAHTLQELCYRYFGDDGIVDVYSTNPNLSHIENYGDVMYVKSVEDYERWKYYEYLKRMVVDTEKELDEWDKRDDVPFNQRPKFSPIYSREDLDGLRIELSEYDMSFVPPIRYEGNVERND